MDFLFEETLEEAARGPGHLDLGPADELAFRRALLLDFLKVDLDRVADLENLVADQLLGRQFHDGVAADVDGNAPVAGLFDRAGEHLADMVLVHFVKGGLLGHPDVAAKSALDAVDRDLAEAFDRAIDRETVARLEILDAAFNKGKEVFELIAFVLVFGLGDLFLNVGALFVGRVDRVFDRDLEVVVLDFLDDVLDLGDDDGSVLLVEGDVDDRVVAAAEATNVAAGDGFLDGGKDVVDFNAFAFGDQFGRV